MLHTADGDDRPPARDMAALLASHPHQVDGDELRQGFDTRGIQFGPAFTGLACAHTAEGTGETVLAEVGMPGSIRAQQGAYGVHPALLDACFQSVAAHPAEKFQSLGQNRSGTSKFLAELDELTQEEWPTRLRRLISEQVGLILRRTVDADRPLSEFGLDSLGNLELRTHIEAETKIRITTADITTIRGLADLLFDKLSSKADIAAPS